MNFCSLTYGDNLPRLRKSVVDSSVWNQNPQYGKPSDPDQGGKKTEIQPVPLV